MAQHARDRHCARAHWLLDISAHAPAAIARQLSLRRYAGKIPNVLVVQFRRDAKTIESVCSNAQRALLLGAVVHVRVATKAEAFSDAPFDHAVPDRDRDRDRAHRQPLLHRRRRRLHDLEHRVSHISPRHSRRKTVQSQAVELVH